MSRPVTERDLRAPEFQHGEPDEYEFRGDGKIVRKDRWKTGILNISSILFGPRYEFEIPEVVERVRYYAPPDFEGEDEGIEAAFAERTVTP